MKKTTTIIMLAFMLATTTGCHRVKTNGGFENVLIKQPFFSIFGEGGVEDEPLSAGSVWCAATTSNIPFPITPITITEEFKNMIPADNTPVSFNASLKIKLRKGQSPILYKDFGAAWYEQSLQEYFRTLVRNRASAYKMFDLASKREITDTIQAALFAEVSAYVKELGLPIDIMQVIIGAISPPEEVLNETRNTAAQNQGILTQNARANAELSRKQAEINKAIADQAYRNQMGMTIAEYQHQRQLEIEKEKVELIKDNHNITIIFGNANPVVPTK